MHAECDKISSKLFKVLIILDFLFYFSVTFGFVYPSSWTPGGSLTCLWFQGSGEHWLLLPRLQSKVQSRIISFRKMPAKNEVCLHYLCFFFSAILFGQLHILLYRLTLEVIIKFKPNVAQFLKQVCRKWWTNCSAWEGNCGVQWDGRNIHSKTSFVSLELFINSR